MEKLIVITGTPGTGKSTLAEHLGKRIGAEVIGANEIAKRYGYEIGKDGYGTSIIDMGKLERKINQIAKEHYYDRVINLYPGEEMPFKYKLNLLFRVFLGYLVNLPLKLIHIYYAGSVAILPDLVAVSLCNLIRPYYLCTRDM